MSGTNTLAYSPRSFLNEWIKKFNDIDARKAKKEADRVKKRLEELSQVSDAFFRKRYSLFKVIERGKVKLIIFTLAYDLAYSKLTITRNFIQDTFLDDYLGRGALLQECSGIL